MSEAVQEHKAAAKVSIRVGVITVSDTRTLETDTSGQLIEQIALLASHQVAWRQIVHDEPSEIQRNRQGSVRSIHPGDSDDRRHRHKPS